MDALDGDLCAEMSQKPFYYCFKFFLVVIKYLPPRNIRFDEVRRLSVQGGRVCTRGVGPEGVRSLARRRTMSLRLRRLQWREWRQPHEVDLRTSLPDRCNSRLPEHAHSTAPSQPRLLPYCHIGQSAVITLPGKGTVWWRSRAYTRGEHVVTRDDSWQGVTSSSFKIN